MRGAAPAPAAGPDGGPRMSGSQDTSAIEITLLEGVHARCAEGSVIPLPTKKAVALMAYLALRPGETHSRVKLGSLLWADTQEEQGRHSLRQTLLSLRKSLPALA